MKRYEKVTFWLPLQHIIINHDDVKHGQFREFADFVAEMRWPMRSALDLLDWGLNRLAKTSFWTCPMLIIEIASFVACPHEPSSDIEQSRH